MAEYPFIPQRAQPKSGLYPQLKNTSVIESVNNNKNFRNNNHQIPLQKDQIAYDMKGK